MSGKSIKKIDVVENDVFSDLRKSAQETTPSITLLKESLIMINEAQKEIENQAKKIKGQLLKVDPSEAKNQKELTAAVKEATKIAQEHEKAQKAKVVISKQLTVEQAKEKEALRQANLQSKQIARLKLAEVNSIEAVRAKLALVTTAWTRLTKEEIENTKRGARLNESKKQLTETLKKLEQATGDHRRDVGNYGSALDNLKGKFGSLIGLASQFGLALGGVAVVSKSIKVLEDFDEGAADIAKTTGLTVEKTKQLTQELLKFDTKTSVSELQGLAAAAGSLNVEGEKNIIGFVEAADKAFVALGDDLGGTSQEIATNVGKIAGVFGDEKRFGIGEAINKIGSAINDLAGKSKAAAAPILDFTQRMAGLGNLISSADTAALGAFFDEGGQSVEVASSTLNTLLPKMAQNYKEFAKTAGMSAEEFKKLAEESPIEALKAVANGAKNSEKGLFNLSKTVESFGVDSARATSIVGFLANNTDRLTELQKISNDAFRDGTSLSNEFNTKNETLAAVWGKVTKAVDSYIISADGASGASEWLKTALSFIASNLPTIINLVIKLGGAYLAYKAIVKGLELKDQFNNWRNVSKGIKEAGDNLGDSAEKARGFGNALKGIGFAVAINLAIELGMEIYNIASGAADATRKLEKMNKAMTAGNDGAALKIKQLREEVGLGKITEQQMKDRIRDRVKDLSLQRQEVVTALDRLKSMDIYQTAISKNPLLRDLKEEVILRGVEDLRSRLFRLDSALTTYNQELTDIAISEVQAAEAIKETNTATGTKIKETEDLTKKLEVLKWVLRDTTEEEKKLAEVRKLSMNPEEVEAALALEKERLLTISDIALLEAEIALKKAEQTGDTEAIRKAEEAVKQAKIDAINAQLKYDLANETDPAKQRELKLKAELDILNLNSKEKEEIAKKNFENEKKYIDLTDQYIQQSLNKRIEAIDREIEASKKRVDDLREQSNQGNVDAKESIALQEQIQADAQLKKEKLERRKQQVAAITAFFQTYLSEREKGTPSAEAFAIAGLDKAALESVVNLLPTFLEGTDRTPNVGAGIDGKGGFHAILHPDEIVLTKEEREAIGGISRAEIVEKVQKYDLQKMGNNTVTGWENIGMIAELSGVRKGLTEIKKAVENIPETNIELGAVTQTAMEIVERRRVGNKRTQSTFKVRG